MTDQITELTEDSLILPVDMARITGAAAGFTPFEIEETIAGRTVVWTAFAQYAGDDVHRRATTEGLTLDEWKQLSRNFADRPERIRIQRMAETARSRAAASGDDDDLAYESSMVWWSAVADHAGRRDEAFNEGLTTREWRDLNAEYHQTKP